MTNINLAKQTILSSNSKIKPKKKGVIYLSRPSKLSIVLASVSTLFLLISLILIAIPGLPVLWYRINPDASQALAQTLDRPATTFGEMLTVSGEQETETYQPAFDSSLPKENRLKIMSLGIDTEILERDQERFEEALRLGVWRVPDFGTPYHRRYPTILVAHRFGYLDWTDEYRRQNSFYYLPKLSPGDQVEIIWNQRKYLFEIYSGEESEEINNYTADLILYTCKFLDSNIRIFRYARLVKSG